MKLFNYGEANLTIDIRMRNRNTTIVITITNVRKYYNCYSQSWISKMNFWAKNRRKVYHWITNLRICSNDIIRKIDIIIQLWTLKQLIEIHSSAHETQTIGKPFNWQSEWWIRKSNLGDDNNKNHLIIFSWILFWSWINQIWLI